MNLVTAYVDASNVYGSTPEVANALRNGYGGSMKTSGRETCHTRWSVYVTLDLVKYGLNFQVKNSFLHWTFMLLTWD